MKRYRIKTDIKHPLFFIPKGTEQCRIDAQYVYFKTSTGSEFALLRKDLKEDNEWVEEVRPEPVRFNPAKDYHREFMGKYKKEGACFTHEDLRLAFLSGRMMSKTFTEVVEYHGNGSTSGDVGYTERYTYLSFEDYLKSKS